jgi:hypothetical protein
MSVRTTASSSYASGVFANSLYEAARSDLLDPTWTSTRDHGALRQIYPLAGPIEAVHFVLLAVGQIARPSLALLTGAPGKAEPPAPPPGARTAR